MNHFSKMCNAQRIQVVDVDDEEYETGSEGYVIESIHVDSINTEKDWMQQVEVIDYKNKKLMFKLDTGAQCNVLPVDMCIKLGIKTIEKTNLILKNYAHERIKTIGKVNLNCKIEGHNQNLRFEIYDGRGTPIIGLPTIRKCNLLIKPENNVDLKVELNEVCEVKILEKIPKFLHMYTELFTGVDKIKDFKYRIKLKNNVCGKVEPSRHVPFKLQQKLKMELNKMEKMGIIKKIEKPTEFVSSLVMVNKPGGKIRICLDPQYLNSCILREQQQFPTIEEIASKLNGAKYFTTLDANKAFWQIELCDESQEYTTFNTPYGRYCYQRLPYGLNSSPEVFHRVYSKIFENIENVVIYIDDTLIWAETVEQSNEILKKVLEQAKKYNVRFNKDKCKFNVTEVRYMGHIINQSGLNVDPDKVKLIYEMQEPKTQKELLRFLGTINYVGKFIPNLSQITANLRQLTRSRVPFLWNENHSKEYAQLKEMLCKPPVLAFFDMSKEIVLSVDASSEGTGCVLLQNDRPVAYGSKALNDTEKTYSQIEKECLAILHGCTKFYQYLYGQSFIVETDHKPLVAIFNKPLNKCPPRLHRIRISLQPYNFKIVYKPGKQIVIADHLSRTYSKEKTELETEKIETFVCMVTKNADFTDERLKEIEIQTNNDQELQIVKKYIQEGWPENKNNVNELAKPYWSFKEELSTSNGLILKNFCIVIPKNCRKHVLQQIHYPHLGIEKTKAFARQVIFWPGLNKHIEDMVSNCDTCLSYRNKNSKEPMLLKKIPDGPWEIVSTDIFKFKENFYLLVVDTYSKFVEVEKLDNLGSHHIVETLKKIFSRLGIPKVVYSDSGSQFTSELYRKFSNEWNFKCTITSPKHHQANGLAERYIETVKKMFYKIVQEKRDIHLALLQYRNTPINDMGVTPTELLFGRKTRNLIPFCKNKPISRREFKENLINNQLKQKEYFDRGAKMLSPLKEGDYVKIHDENRVLPHRNGVIVREGSEPRSYQVKTEEGRILCRNRKMLSKGTNFNTADKYGDEISNTELSNTLPPPEPQESELLASADKEVTPNQSQNHGTQENEPMRQTRSGRTVKMPSKYKDFVLN
ncbi:hypothetical protein TKK_0002912 [Trichogramma kaykai]